jgi:hypothetical protein
MDYLLQLIELKKEWEKIKISGKEYAKVINDDYEKKNKKIEEILKYRDKVINSELTSEDKERYLKEISENLEYLNSKSNFQNYLNLLNNNGFLPGLIVGGILVLLLSKGIEWMENYIVENVSRKIQG